jgi:amino-acid N-acetyltransferase
LRRAGGGPDFRREGYGEALLHEIEQRARKLRLTRLFVLTTRTSGWFVERGFVESDPARLPKQKRDLYNWQRRSLVYEKTLA